MKKLIVIFLAAGVLFNSGILVFAQGAQNSKVIAYYFHGSFRCVTCTNMEKYSREAVETNFKDELSSGALEFKPVNVEEPENKHFVNDYQLFTKTLILSLVKDGKEIKSKNLAMIWEYTHNKQKFIDYLTEEIRAFLEETK